MIMNATNNHGNNTATDLEGPFVPTTQKTSVLNLKICVSLR